MTKLVSQEDILAKQKFLKEHFIHFKVYCFLKRFVYSFNEFLKEKVSPNNEGEELTFSFSHSIVIQEEQEKYKFDLVLFKLDLEQELNSIREDNDLISSFSVETSNELDVSVFCQLKI